MKYEIKIALLNQETKNWSRLFLGCRYPNFPQKGDQICRVSSFYAKTPEKITFHSDKVEDLW